MGMLYGAGALPLKPALVVMAILTFVGATSLSHAVRAYFHRPDSRIRAGQGWGCPRPDRAMNYHRTAGVVMGRGTVGGLGARVLLYTSFSQLSGLWIDLQQGVARGLVTVGAFASLTLGPMTSPIPAPCFLAPICSAYFFYGPKRSSTGGRRARFPHIDDLGTDRCHGRRRHRPQPKRRPVAGLKTIFKGWLIGLGVGSVLGYAVAFGPV